MGRAKGLVEAKTSGGHIRIEGAGGKVAAAASGGSIYVGDAGGLTTLKASGGNVDLGGAAGSVEIAVSGGRATASEVRTVIERVRERVEGRSGIVLELEIELVGF